MPSDWSATWNPDGRPVEWNFSKALDLDFLGFTYNGKHSKYDMNVWRVIDGDRYTSEMHPSLTDKTAEVPGGDGMYYFGTNHKQKDIPIQFAFDHMTEEQFREWKNLCNGKELADLIFDEHPYKVYTAKPTGTSSIKYLCFDEKDSNGNKKRIYKGEGSITFTCYWPYAHTPNEFTKISSHLRNSGRFGKDGKILDNYSDNLYPTKGLWAAASGITNTKGKLENPGDLPAPFKVTKGGEVAEGTMFKVGALSVTVTSTCYDFEWDSRTGMVIAAAVSGGAKAPIEFTGNSCGAIPVGGTTTYKLNDGTLTYDYWYY